MLRSIINWLWSSEGPRPLKSFDWLCNLLLCYLLVDRFCTMGCAHTIPQFVHIRLLLKYFHPLQMLQSILLWEVWGCIHPRESIIDSLRQILRSLQSWKHRKLIWCNLKVLVARILSCSTHEVREQTRIQELLFIFCASLMHRLFWHWRNWNCYR